MSTMVIPEKPLAITSPRANHGPAVGKARPEGGFRKILKSSSRTGTTKAGGLSVLEAKQHGHRTHPPIASLSQGKTVKAKPKKLAYSQQQAETLSMTPQLMPHRSIKPAKTIAAAIGKDASSPTPSSMGPNPLEQASHLPVPVKVGTPRQGPAVPQEAHVARETHLTSGETRSLIVSRRLAPATVLKGGAPAKSRTVTAAKPLGDTADVGQAAPAPLVPVELAPPGNNLKALTTLKPILVTTGTEPFSKVGAAGVKGWQVRPVSIRGQVGLQATRWKVSPPGLLRATIELGLSNSPKGWAVEIAASHGDASWLTGAVANVSQLSQNFAKHGWNLSEVSLWNTSAGNSMGNNPSYSAFGQAGQGTGGQMDRGFGRSIGSVLSTETSRLSNSLQAVDYTA